MDFFAYAVDDICQFLFVHHLCFYFQSSVVHFDLSSFEYRWQTNSGEYVNQEKHKCHLYKKSIENAYTTKGRNYRFTVLKINRLNILEQSHANKIFNKNKMIIVSVVHSSPIEWNWFILTISIHAVTCKSAMTITEIHLSFASPQIMNKNQSRK